MQVEPPKKNLQAPIAWFVAATMLAAPLSYWALRSIYNGSKLDIVPFSTNECFASIAGSLSLALLIVALKRLIYAKHGVDTRGFPSALFWITFGFFFSYILLPDLLAASFHQIGAFSRLVRGFVLATFATVNLYRSIRKEEEQKQIRALFAYKFMIIITLVMAMRRRSAPARWQ